MSHWGRPFDSLGICALWCYAVLPARALAQLRIDATDESVARIDWHECLDGAAKATAVDATRTLASRRTIG